MPVPNCFLRCQELIQGILLANYFFAGPLFSINWLWNKSTVPIQERTAAGISGEHFRNKSALRFTGKEGIACKVFHIFAVGKSGVTPLAIMLIPID